VGIPKAIKEPTVVVLTRLKNDEDLSQSDTFQGVLVDSGGGLIEAPMIGCPIYLSGQDQKPIFKTDPVIQVDTHDGYWEITTESGTLYAMENARTYH
jgi:hypothetical protein